MNMTDLPHFPRDHADVYRKLNAQLRELETVEAPPEWVVDLLAVVATAGILSITAVLVWRFA